MMKEGPTRLRIVALVMLTCLGACSFGLGRIQDSKPDKKEKSPKGFVRKEEPASYFKNSPPRTSRKAKSPAKNSYSGIFVKSSKNPKIKAGDQILSIKDSSGQSFPMKSPADFDNFLKAHPKPSRATIRVEREGKYHTFVVTRIANVIKI